MSETPTPTPTPAPVVPDMAPLAADPSVEQFRHQVLEAINTGIGAVTLVGALLVILLAVLVVRHW